MSSRDSCPRVLGPYVLLVPLAQGGMGSVVLGAPLGDRDKLCLLKLLKPGLSNQHDYLPRFVDEAKVAVALIHENICRVFDAGEVSGELYLAMELIEGVTFKRLMELAAERGQNLSAEEAVALAVGMLRGLHAAQTATMPGSSVHLNVVHRDVSPHNAMIDVHGGVKVIDFGLATSVLKATVTESAVVLGKSSYMAPEQARGEDVGRSVDQYAAAIVLYELLVGDRYYGDLPTRAVWAIAGSGNHVPRSWDKVPVGLAAILRRALAPRPDDRFPTCAAFADALEDVVPAATQRAMRERLGAFVRSLAPDELKKIDEARGLLASLREEEIAQSTEATQPTRLQSQTETGSVVLTPASLLGAQRSGQRSAEGEHHTESTRLVGIQRDSATFPANLSSPARHRMASRTVGLLAAAIGVPAVLAFVSSTWLNQPPENTATVAADRLAGEVSAPPSTTTASGTMPPPVSLTSPDPPPSRPAGEGEASSPRATAVSNSTSMRRGANKSSTSAAQRPASAVAPAANLDARKAAVIAASQKSEDDDCKLCERTMKLLPNSVGELSAGDKAAQTATQKVRECEQRCGL